MGWTAGKRQVRVKTAIVNLLKQNPDGLAATELQDKLKDSNKGRRASPKANAISQLCKCTPGVSRAEEDRVIPTGYEDGSTRKVAVWVLTDEEAFRAWAE